MLTFLVLAKPGATYAQSTEGYKDFALSGQNILLLTKAGAIKRIDVASRKPALFMDTEVPIVAIGIDRQGNIVAGDTNNLVRLYDDKRKTWHPLAHSPNKLISLVFNSQNQCFLITSKGIFDALTTTNYFPDPSFSGNTQVRFRGPRFQPAVCFIDHQDKLWLGFDYGEWGGDVLSFDTRKRVFSLLKMDSLNMTMNPVTGFCENPPVVYMSGGVSHMFLTHGSMARFVDGAASFVLQSKDRKTEVEATSKDPVTGQEQKRILTVWRGGHQIGPSAYNPATNCLYFYSQHGIFKGSLDADLSDIKQWSNILNPKLSWPGGSPNAAGPAMNVVKMQFMTDGTLLFLTEQEGLGIYDGKELRFVR